MGSKDRGGDAAVKNGGQRKWWKILLLLVLGLSLCAVLMFLKQLSDYREKRTLSFLATEREDIQFLQKSFVGSYLSDPCYSPFAPSYEQNKCLEKKAKNAAENKAWQDEFKAGHPDLIETKTKTLSKCRNGGRLIKDGLRSCYEIQYVEELRFKITSYCLEKYRINEGIPMEDCRAEREKTWTE